MGFITADRLSGQLAHEQALLDLLETELKRIVEEGDSCKAKGRPEASSDLERQLQLLEARVEEQHALVEDIEYKYFEASEGQSGLPSPFFKFKTFA
ncbi:unnamed protein product [Protopolystoma xenopodis]|uniref:BMERB domain-containing protein n=1 Tax=Protopolystoma xenopodis TaxID=117903 RepID=A0A448XPD2_9PLAT|nr:unnamed protein product [Protopolystoma xenopodis]